jgi:protein-disulfide isomerase/peroxiredoxin/uncharacterized membrane protein
MSAVKLSVSAALSAAAAGWAIYLVKLHNDAIASSLRPGLLCGEDGGCSDVLASQWSVIAGLPVSAPAVPMYVTLLVLSLLALRGRLDVGRLSGLVTMCGLAGLAFGGWLLYHMLADVGKVCNYCLVMDGLNLAVLASGIALHPDGPAAAFRAIPTAFAALFRPSLEAVLIPAVVLGAGLLHLALPAPEGPTEAEIAAAVAAAIEPVAPEVTVEPVPVTAGVAEETGETKRVLLQPAAAEIPLAGVPIKGSPDAPVTIVLFEDFQCPFCRTLAGNLEALLASRPDDVKIAWYNFPMHTACNSHAPKDMHPRACAAAMAGVCANEQGRFWELHDSLFFHSAKLSDRELRQYAGEVGLDVGAFDQCMQKPQTLARVQADADVGAGLGVRGTPTFYINGRRLSGAQPIEVLEAVVDAVQSEDRGERVSLDVALRGEVLGDVAGPASASLEGPYGRFKIDTFEASIVDGAAVSRPGVEPARGVSWYQASEACEAAGKRLCTEEEWLSACTGSLPDDVDGDGIYSDDTIIGRLHPYGTYPQPTWCASARQRDDARPLLTGNHPRCATPEGVYDLEGGVKEWVGLSPDRAGLKGGSYYSGQSARCGYFKDDLPPDGGDDSMGFRCCRGSEPEDTAAERYPGGKVGDTLMNFSLPTPEGGTYGSADLEDQAVVLTFWASWCGPCRKELPALADFYNRYKDQGLAVVGVNIDKDVRAAQAYLRRDPLPFPVVLDTDNALMGSFDAQSVPTTFWVTRAGQIRQKTTGYSEEKKDEVEAFVEELLRR